MKKLTGAISIILCLLLFTFTPVLGNLFSILTENEYIIPKESSIFTFEATKMNEGSGGWWMYGEDNKKYYALSMNSINKIISIDKGQSQKIKNFDKLNYKTWEKNEEYILFTIRILLLANKGTIIKRLFNLFNTNY